MAEAIPFVEIENDVDGLIGKRILHELADGVEMWSLRVTALSRWEDENLLDHPTPEKLGQHKWWVENSLRLGRLISWSTGHPEFPDQRLAADVAATMEVLRDKLKLFHGPRISKERSDEILKGCGLI